MKHTAFNRLFSAILAVCLIAALMPMTLSAEGEESEQTPETFTVTYKTSGNGTVEGKDTAEAGETVTLTLKPDEGNVVSKIEADFDGFALTEKNAFIMPKKNVVITVEFAKEEPKTYQIWASAGTGGSIYPTVCTVKEGESQFFVATPADGYTIKNLYVDNIAVGAFGFYVFNDVKSFHTIRAEFEKIEVEVKPETFTVKFMDYDGSLISEQTVEAGKPAVEPKTPVRDGYVFRAWSGAFTVITADTTLLALYDEIKKPEDTAITKLFVYVSGGENKASDIVLDTKKIGDMIQLYVKSEPEKELKNVTYTSSDTDVALVTSAGKVAVLAHGTATITATCEGKTARYIVLCLNDEPVKNPDTADD